MRIGWKDCKKTCDRQQKSNWAGSRGIYVETRAPINQRLEPRYGFGTACVQLDLELNFNKRVKLRLQVAQPEQSAQWQYGQPRKIKMDTCTARTWLGRSESHFRNPYSETCRRVLSKLFDDIKQICSTEL